MKDDFRKVSRRDFSQAGLIGLSGLGLPLFANSGLLSSETQANANLFKIADITRTTVRVPYRETPRRAMDRELPHWRYSEIFEVALESGKTGIGETLLFYTWGATDDQDVERALGKNAVDIMWDDTLGAGLQMSLFDAVAKTIGVPIHRLFGKQVNEKTPLSWWNIDMPPADMASECVEALRSGYTSYKTKGRPWFDLWDQIEQTSQVVPESFKIDMDFNDTLWDAERAIPVLKDFESNPRIDIYETPIPQGDVAGNKAITAATSISIAHHFGNPPPAIAVREKACDGFVIGGGASRVLQNAAFAKNADMPFWLQLVGTGITAAYSLHFGAVCSHATWPAVNCHQLYKHDLLKESIEVKEGFAAIPQKPGIGVELDREAIEKYKTEKPKSRPEPKRLMETSWPDGKRMYVANNGRVNFMITASKNMPYVQRGVKTRVIPNDGSDSWRHRYERARQKPFFE